MTLPVRHCLRRWGCLTGECAVPEVLARLCWCLRGGVVTRPCSLDSVVSDGFATVTGVRVCVSLANTAPTPLCCSKNPPYGSSVVFELVEYNENGLGDTDGVAVDPANLYVRAFYNRGVASIFSETFVVPGCSSHLCPLNEFFTNTQDIVPENWELECNGVEPMEPKEMSMGLAVLILTLCGLLGIAVGAGAVWYYRRSQERGRTFGRRRLTDDDELAEDEPRGDFGRTVELTDAAGQAARGSDAGGAV